jgi:hypothetical protein
LPALPYWEGKMVVLARQHAFGTWLVAGFLALGALSVFWH